VSRVPRVVAAPKPRLVKVVVTAQGMEPFSVGGFSRQGGTGASAQRRAHVSGLGGSPAMTGQAELAPFGVKLPGNALIGQVAAPNLGRALLQALSWSHNFYSVDEGVLVVRDALFATDVSLRCQFSGGTSRGTTSAFGCVFFSDLGVPSVFLGDCYS